MGAKKIISLLLALSLLTGTVGSISACTPLAGEGAPQAETEKENVLGGGLLVTPEETPEEETPVTITARALSAEEYAENDIMPIAESAQQLTATLSPSGSEGSVDWSVAWKNASSEWASGKTVTDYVTVTPTKDGALTANVSCLQAFGEQVIITAALRGTSARATVTADYRRGINHLDFSITLTHKATAAQARIYDFEWNLISSVGIKSANPGRPSNLRQFCPISYPFGEADWTDVAPYFVTTDTTDVKYNYTTKFSFNPTFSKTYTIDAEVGSDFELKIMMWFNHGFVSDMQNFGKLKPSFTGTVVSSDSFSPQGSFTVYNMDFCPFVLFGIAPASVITNRNHSYYFKLLAFRNKLSEFYTRYELGQMTNYPSSYYSADLCATITVNDKPVSFWYNPYFTFD